MVTLVKPKYLKYIVFFLGFARALFLKSRKKNRKIKPSALLCVSRFSPSWVKIFFEDLGKISLGKLGQKKPAQKERGKLDQKKPAQKSGFFCFLLFRF